ncbi:MAG: 6-bladed beta-propeller [Bacteroidota bacterium]
MALPLDPRLADTMLSFVSVFDSLFYLQLEPSPLPLNSLFIKVKYVSPFILVIDHLPFPAPEDAQVLLYDEAGQLINKVGEYGTGIGQYRQIRDAYFSPEGTEIWLFPDDPAYLLRFSLPEARFISAVKLPENIPYQQVAPFDSTSLLFGNTFQPNFNGEPAHHFYRWNWRDPDNMHAFVPFHPPIHHEIPVQGRTGFYPGKEFTWATLANHPAIYQFDHQEGIFSTFPLDFSPGRFEQEFLYPDLSPETKERACCFSTFIVQENFALGDFRYGKDWTSQRFLFHRPRQRLFQFPTGSPLAPFTPLSQVLGHGSSHLILGFGMDDYDPSLAELSRLTPVYRQAWQKTIARIDPHGGPVLAIMRVQE